MVEEENSKDKSVSAHPFDDAFKSTLVHCRQIVVPMVNEMFKTNYALTEEIRFSNTELYHLSGDTKRDVDTSFRVGNSSKLYHMECESSPHGDIVWRMFEYDTMLGLQNYSLDKGKLTVEFPRSAVLFLRSNGNTPDELEVHVRIHGRELCYTMPTMKISDYTLDDIFAKKLYFLLPFHFFVYESRLEEYNRDESKLNELLKEFDSWVERLFYVNEQEIPYEVKGNIVTYAYNVMLALCKKQTRLSEGVNKHMGGVVSQYSPMEQKLRDAVAVAIKDAVKDAVKEKDEVIAKKDARIAELEKALAAATAK